MTDLGDALMRVAAIADEISERESANSAAVGRAAALGGSTRQLSAATGRSKSSVQRDLRRAEDPAVRELRRRKRQADVATMRLRAAEAELDLQAEAIDFDVDELIRDALSLGYHLDTRAASVKAYDRGRTHTEEVTMAVVYIQEFPIEKRSTENYDFINERIGEGPFDGLICHTAGFDDDANVFRIFDVWESREQAKRFIAEHIQPLIDQGPSAFPDPANITEPIRDGFYELHNVVAQAGVGAASR